MVTVVFHLTDFDPLYGLESPRNHINEFVQLCQAFGVDKIIMIDKTEFKIGQHYSHKSSNILYDYSTSLEDLYDSCSGEMIWVFMEAKDSIIIDDITPKALKEFIHPENAIYVVGPDFTTINPQPFYNNEWVYIEMLKFNPLYGKYAISIMLYDRLIKQQ